MLYFSHMSKIVEFLTIDISLSGQKKDRHSVYIITEKPPKGG